MQKKSLTTLIRLSHISLSPQQPLGPALRSGGFYSCLKFTFGGGSSFLVS